MPDTTAGYHGRYLKIDISTGHTETIPIPQKILRNYIGGCGLGTWLLLKETAGNIDPFSPAAPLIVVFSPLVGSPLTTSAKFSILAKSPLTNRINDSLSSSRFAILGKRTGYDAFVITGSADKPAYLLINDDATRIEDADSLWGQEISATAAALKAKLKGDNEFMVIGPAGENRVRYASISNDGRHAGRGGLGAVMGSKNLKAIAVGGNKRTSYAHPQQLIAYSKDLSQKSFGPATAKYRELGTVSNLLAFNRLGTLPTRNFQSGSFAEAEQIAPENFSHSHAHTRASCAACTIGCEHIFQIRSSNKTSPENNNVRLEYESLFALGSLCGISSIDTVLQAVQRCDELGIDTISTGATIAFAMECTEKSWLADSTLRFGDDQACLYVIDQIARREGLGDLLAEGSRLAAEQIGTCASAIAPHVKGLEMPGYEPRSMQSMALGLAVGTRGADHNKSGAYQIDFSDQADRLNIDELVIPRVIETENEAALMDSLILCKFLRGVFDDKVAAMADMLHLVTGWDYSSTELRQTAERIITAKKWYNITQGWQPAEDTLPERFLSEPLDAGTQFAATLTRETLSRMIELYNRNRNWTSEGWVREAAWRNL